MCQGRAFRSLHRGRLRAATPSAFCVRLALILPLVVGVAALLGSLSFLKQVGVEDGRADLVLPRRPVAEVDGAAAVGAEGDVVGVQGDFLAADGTVEGFGHNSLSLDDEALQSCGYCGSTSKLLAICDVFVYGLLKGRFEGSQVVSLIDNKIANAKKTAVQHFVLRAVENGAVVAAMMKGLTHSFQLHAAHYIVLRRLNDLMSSVERANHSPLCLFMPVIRFESKRLCQYCSMPSGSSVEMR
jgi:hypothetical protein